jgi:hypothetical protein
VASLFDDEAGMSHAVEGHLGPDGDARVAHGPAGPQGQDGSAGPKVKMSRTLIRIGCSRTNSC